MKNFLTVLLSFALCLPLAAQSETQYADTLVSDSLPWPQCLQARVDSLLEDHLLKTTQLGLMIYDLTADSTLYAHDHLQTLRPASTMKLLTSITALEQLSADYQLSTTLYYNGSVADGTLLGNLRVVGGMDPLFDSTDLTAFVSQLRGLGVDTIRGRILTDRSFKDEDLFGEGWCWDDDNPELSPLLVDRKDDFVERFERELRLEGVVLIDTLITPKGRRKVNDSRHVCTRSHCVDSLLMQMMKESDNLYAEALFYHLAANAGARPAKAKQAATQIKKMIQRVALRPGDYKIADGSGLSLYNYVSPQLEVRLLRYAWRRRPMFDRLFSVLPIAGIDGTLKKRMLEGAAAGNVRAKTGTVTGISSLAGYCTAANGHELCFSIINQGILHQSDGRGFQDRLCEVMCK